MSRKKDILAVTTFLATGLLFLMTQAGKPSSGLDPTDVWCDAAETVVVHDGVARASTDLEMTLLMGGKS